MAVFNLYMAIRLEADSSTLEKGIDIRPAHPCARDENRFVFNEYRAKSLIKQLALTSEYASKQ